MNTSINSTPVGLSGKLQNNIAAPYDFTIRDVMTESWKRVKGAKASYWGALGWYFLIYVGITITGLLATYFYAGSLNPELLAVKTSITITRLLALLITSPLPIGICLLAIRHCINLPIKAKQAFTAYRCYWRILATLIIIYLALFLIAFATIFMVEFLSAIVVKNAGTAPIWLHSVVILLSVAGVFIGAYFASALGFAPLLVLEKPLSVFQAIKASFLAFKQHGLKIIFAYFLMIIIYVVSAIPFGLGMIWTLPMLFNLEGVLYRTLFGVEKNAQLNG